MVQWKKQKQKKGIWVSLAYMIFCFILNDLSDSVSQSSTLILHGLSFFFLLYDMIDELEI